jgi:hypothetical protein
MNWPKPGKLFTVRFGPASQSIGRGRISREGALDVRESRERRDKIVPFFSPEKQGKSIFGPASFPQNLPRWHAADSLVAISRKKS